MYLLMLKYIRQPDVSCKMHDLWFFVKLDSKNEKKIVCVPNNDIIFELKTYLTDKKIDCLCS